jgi:hypothetical protein
MLPCLASNLWGQGILPTVSQVAQTIDMSHVQLMYYFYNPENEGIQVAEAGGSQV